MGFAVAESQSTALPPLEERPLVTFALFAYNQEKYIREAVEGAFAQTYEPLEIILSDDCSTDRTFEIMEEMAKAYSGRHRIITIKQPQNIGTIDHVLAVAELSQGQLIVVAAGDDVSLPERTEKLAERWMSSNASIIYSGRAIVDEDGAELGVEPLPEPMPKIQSIFEGTSCAKRYDGKVRNIPGYSAAYVRTFLKDIPKCGSGALNEDALTTVLANLNSNEIEAIALPLLKYRHARTSVSSRQSTLSVSSIKENEERTVRFSCSSVKFYPYLFDVMKSSKARKEDLDVVAERLQEIYREVSLIKEVAENNFLGRAVLLLSCRSVKELKIVASRIFGLRFFAAMKFVVLKSKNGLSI